MNKRLTVAVLLALLPLSLQISAQDVPADKSSAIVKNHREETLPVARTAADGVQAVDLDEASAAHDVVLPQQPVHMTADKVLVRGKDGFVAGRGNVDIMRGMDEIHANTIEGNTKSQVYHTVGKAVYLNSTMALETTGLTYSGTGPGATMDTVQGFMDPMTYIRGTGAEMYDGTGYVRHGLITTPVRNSRQKIRNCGSRTSVSSRMVITKADWTKTAIRSRGSFPFCRDRRIIMTMASVCVAMPVSP